MVKERLKQIIIRSQEIYEESWDKEKASYSTSLEEAAKRACNEYGIEGLSEVIWLLNGFFWNDIQKWAKETK